MDDREERIHFITYIAYLNCSVAKSLSLITGVLASCHGGYADDSRGGARSAFFLPFFHLIKS